MSQKLEPVPEFSRPIPRARLGGQVLVEPLFLVGCLEVLPLRILPLLLLIGFTVIALGEFETVDAIQFAELETGLPPSPIL